MFYSVLQLCLCFVFLKIMTTILLNYSIALCETIRSKYLSLYLIFLLLLQFLVLIKGFLNLGTELQAQSKSLCLFFMYHFYLIFYFLTLTFAVVCTVQNADSFHVTVFGKHQRSA